MKSRMKTLPRPGNSTSGLCSSMYWRVLVLPRFLFPLCVSLSLFRAKSSGTMSGRMAKFWEILGQIPPAFCTNSNISFAQNSFSWRSSVSPMALIRITIFCIVSMSCCVRWRSILRSTSIRSAGLTSSSVSSSDPLHQPATADQALPTFSAAPHAAPNVFWYSATVFAISILATTALLSPVSKFSQMLLLKSFSGATARARPSVSNSGFPAKISSITFFSRALVAFSSFSKQPSSFAADQTPRPLLSESVLIFTSRGTC
mmetsp:Transcript_27491/g.56906  ORF Transcript_27491/g.56906 Transcript_27491/m.56906 type:complete len:259 (-) Transcript_27491:445-1221(-)